MWTVVTCCKQCSFLPSMSCLAVATYCIKNCSAVFIISKLMACSTIGFHLFHWPTRINTIPFHFSLIKYVYIASNSRHCTKKNCISHSNKRTRYNTITGHTTTASTTVLHQEQLSSQPYQLFPLVYSHSISTKGKNTCLHEWDRLSTLVVMMGAIT